MRKIKLKVAVSYSKARMDYADLDIDTYISTDNLLQNKLGKTKATQLPASISNAQKYCQGNILVSNIRPYLRKIYFAKENGGASSDILIFVTKEGYIPKYVYYALYQNSFFEHLMAGSKGTKMPRGDKSQALEFEIPNYSQDTQQKIAAVLSSLDDKIELNNKINAELEAMAKTLYDYWFVQFDFPISKEQALAMGNPKLEGKPYKTSGGKMVWNEVLKREIPEGWEDEKIDNLGSIIGGSTPSKAIQENFTDSGIAWITPKDLSLNVGNKFISKGELDVSERGLKEASLNILPKGSVLMSSRAPVGYLAINQNDCTTNQGFKSIICNKAYSAEYVYYVLKQYMSTIEANATGSTFKEISASVFRSISIAKPQLSTVKDFVKQINAVFEKQNNLENQNKQLAFLRDWLLPLLMNGQVTVVDSESKVKKVIAEKEQTAKPKNDSYAKIQLLYTTVWANQEIEVKQGEMATAKDVYLLDRIYGVETGFQFKQHNWGSFDPEEKKLLNTKQYFHKVNFPNSKAVYVDLKDDGKLLDKIPTHLKETVFNAISEMNATVFSRYFGTQKAEKKELFATVLKCIEDRQSLELSIIRDEMAHWKIKQGGKESTKADKFTEAETREALEMILKENWHRNVMR